MSFSTTTHRRPNQCQRKMRGYHDDGRNGRSTVFVNSYHIAVMLFAAVLITVPHTSLGDRLGIKCSDNGAFYCHDFDPSSFTRCIDSELFLFKCPDGLHFSSLSQTCDWPANANCGGDRKPNVEQNLVVADGHDTKREEAWNDGHGSSNSHNDVASASGSITMSGSGRPWWRPENVDPKSWEDVDNLVEVPFDGSVSVSASLTGKKGSGSSVKESGPGEQKKEAVSEQKKEAISEPKKEAGGEKKSVAAAAAEGGKGKGGFFKRPATSHTEEKRPDLANVEWHEGPCDRSACKLPHCRCPGTDIPGGLSPKKTPQMVMLTFDDEVSAAYYGYFQRLFRPGRYNPNGCPVRGCLYVSGSGTDYDLVYPLYAMGVEVASHTLSHKFPHTWWATASYQEFVDEIEGMRKTLTSEAGIPYETIKGFRVPFLQLGGDNMYKALYDQKFVYDTSMFTGDVWEGSDPVWPFTLDYTIPQSFCQHDPCPKKQYPGLWEIPVQRWYGLDGHSCAMPDGCTASADAEEDLEFFRSNFRRYYESNRAPFGIFVHARWFHTEHHLEALDRFIDELMSLEDVYIVTPIQVVEWLKNPTSLDNVKNFQPWSCEGSVDKAMGDWRRRR